MAVKLKKKISLIRSFYYSNTVFSYCAGKCGNRIISNKHKTDVDKTLTYFGRENNQSLWFHESLVRYQQFYAYFS